MMQILMFLNLLSQKLLAEQHLSVLKIHVHLTLLVKNSLSIRTEG